MKSAIVISATLLLSGCYNPGNFSFNMPLNNKTNVTSIFCQDWDKIGDDIVKSTCHVDNLNSAETRSLVIRAFDKQGIEIGNAVIGKATIGEKLRINKAMILTKMEKPAEMTLEVSGTL